MEFADYRSEAKKMIDGFIIDKLKHENEEVERKQWEPIPLPLEQYDPCEQEKTQDKPEEFVIKFLLAGAINGSPTSNTYSL